MFTTREVAIAVWGLIAIALLLSKAQLRLALKNLVKTFLARQIRTVFELMGCYIAGCTWLLARIHVWTISNLKSTILWAVGFAFITLFRVDTIERERNFFRKVIAEAVGWNIIIGFVLSTYTLSLPVELLIVPSTAFFAAIAAYLKAKNEHPKLLVFAENLLALFGLFVLAYAVREMTKHFLEFATLQNAREFVVPLMLTFMFLPFLYAVHLYMAYEKAFSRVRHSVKNPIARDHALRRLVFEFNFDVDGLRKWLRHIGLFRPDSETEVEASFREIRSVRRRERRPYKVPPPRGWAPDKARLFLSANKLETGDYYRGYDGWRASSSYLKLGNSVFGNTVAYYVSGEEFAVLELELVLAVNQVEQEATALAEFSKISSTLLNRALQAFCMQDSNLLLVPGAKPVNVRGKTVQLNKEELGKGYELKLVVSAR